MLKNLFPSYLETLKRDLRSLKEDKFSSAYKRVNQPSATGLLEEIETLEHENAEMKEKLSRITELLK